MPYAWISQCPDQWQRNFALIVNFWLEYNMNWVVSGPRMALMYIFLYLKYPCYKAIWMMSFPIEKSCAKTLVYSGDQHNDE